MRPLTMKLLLVLAALLPALYARIVYGQYVLQCDATHVRIVCVDCIFRSNFQ